MRNLRRRRCSQGAIIQIPIGRQTKHAESTQSTVLPHFYFHRTLRLCIPEFALSEQNYGGDGCLLDTSHSVLICTDSRMLNAKLNFASSPHQQFVEIHLRYVGFSRRYVCVTRTISPPRKWARDVAVPGFRGVATFTALSAPSRTLRRPYFRHLVKWGNRNLYDGPA